MSIHHTLQPLRPEPLISDIDVVAYERGTDPQYAIEALEEGYQLLVLDDYSNGLHLMSELGKHLKQNYPGTSYQEQQNYRNAFRKLSHRILAEISHNSLGLKKAPQIGWLKILYPDYEDFLLPFPQIQGLNSAWQWYIKGIYIPVIGKKIQAWYGTYFPTRFEHLELFDEYLQTYRGEKKTAIDIGIGSGILSLQMLKYGFGKIFGSDMHPNAIIGLQEYLEKEKLNADIELFYGDLFCDMQEQSDFIVFNPPWLPIKRRIDGIDKAMYYQDDLFPRFFEQAAQYLNDEGRLVLLFSNLAIITGESNQHPIEEELANNRRFKKETLLFKKVNKASKKTKRKLQRRQDEKVELWVLRKL